jgi:hypothetical protein
MGLYPKQESYWTPQQFREYSQLSLELVFLPRLQQPQQGGCFRRKLDLSQQKAFHRLELVGIIFFLIPNLSLLIDLNCCIYSKDSCNHP